MNENEIFYFLALQCTNGIGAVNARKLINHCGGPRQVFEEKPHILEKISGIGTRIAGKIKKDQSYKNAEYEMDFIQANGIEAISYYDNDYPYRLKQCSDAPLVLFKKGKINCTSRRIISIVGTRLMTPYGKQFLNQFVNDLKRYDPVIVSGLAYGVDFCSHQEALKNGLSTIGILAHGLDMIYPKAHEMMAQEMLNSGGLYTEFWSGNRPERENFVRRNRIVAGISEATIVVESARKGGSLITADMANSYYRDVFAVPGRTHDQFSEGCNMLIKSNKAAMITSVKDLEYILGWKRSDSEMKNNQTRLFDELETDHKEVMNHLLESQKQLLDLIALNCSLSIQRTVIVLLQLELKGLVRSLPGKWYQAV